MRGPLLRVKHKCLSVYQCANRYMLTISCLKGLNVLPGCACAACVLCLCIIIVMHLQYCHSCELNHFWLIYQKKKLLCLECLHMTALSATMRGKTEKSNLDITEMQKREKNNFFIPTNVNRRRNTNTYAHRYKYT